MSTFTSTAFAYTTGYQSLPQPHFTRIPTVCAIDPSYPDLSAGRQSLMMDVVKNGVSEWSSQLGANSPHPQNWYVKYTELASSEAKSFDYSLCDIVIVIKPIPDSLPFCGSNTILGCEQYTQYGFRLITLFYDNYHYCTNSSTGSNVCPDGTVLTTKQFENVELHEFGHALGLGHYVSDDPKLTLAWSTHPDESPSIMIPVADTYPDYQNIEAIDIQKVHELYNYQDFLTFSSKSTSPFTSLTAESKEMEFNGDQTPIVVVNAVISNQYYSPGQKIEFTITDQAGHQIFDSSYYATREDFSENLMPQGFIPGIYTLNAKYAGMSSSNIIFEFSHGSQVQSSNTPASSPSIIQTPPYATHSAIGDKVEGTDYSIQDIMTNGKVLGIKVDTQSKSLIVSIQTTGDGVLTTTLPRGLIDAQINGQDDHFYVLKDGQEADFQETSKTTSDRILSIPFTGGTQNIEIIGTQIIPEFPFAIIVLMIATFSIILIPRLNQII